MCAYVADRARIFLISAGLKWVRERKKKQNKKKHKRIASRSREIVHKHTHIYSL